MFIRNLENISRMSQEELELLRFQPFELKSGLVIMLIPAVLFSLIPDGTKLVSSYGDLVVKGKNYIDTETHSGYIMYGVVAFTAKDKTLISVDEIIKYTYFEGLPWYCMMVGHAEDIPKPSSYHFTHILNNRRNTISKAEYFDKYPLQTLSYLMIVSALASMFDMKGTTTLESLSKRLGYCPVEGDWDNGVSFIESEMSVRMLEALLNL